MSKSILHVSMLLTCAMKMIEGFRGNSALKQTYNESEAKFFQA